MLKGYLTVFSVQLLPETSFGLEAGSFTEWHLSARGGSDEQLKNDFLFYCSTAKVECKPGILLSNDKYLQILNL